MSTNLPTHIKEKIATAKEKQLTELDLSEQSLTEIPAEIFELTQLKVLKLSDNELTEIPESIERYF